MAAPSYPTQPPHQSPYQPHYQPSPYQQPAYPQQFAGPPPVLGWTPPLRTDYAHWGRRVAASLIDFAPALVGTVVLYVGLIGWYIRFVSQTVRGGVPTDLNPFNPTVIVGLAITLVALGIDIWNRWLVGGRTGQSLGKRLLKIWLIDERTGKPIGPLMAFARDLLHRIDSVFYVGYLWPLWDEKRQTFSDKILKSIVVTTPINAPVTTDSR